MNNNMKTTLTPQNINQIEGLLKKRLANGMKDWLDYPTSVKVNRFRKAAGVNKKNIEKSNISIFETLTVETDYMFGKYFIRVHNNGDSDAGTFRAFIIYCGDNINFSHDKITVRTEHPTRHEQKAVQTIIPLK